MHFGGWSQQSHLIKAQGSVTGVHVELECPLCGLEAVEFLTLEQTESTPLLQPPLTWVCQDISLRLVCKQGGVL